MPTSQALRRCPALRVVRPRHALYSRTSERVFSLLRDSVPVIEPISIDEAFLDVSDDPRSGMAVAEDLRRAIRDRFSLPTSWGAAANRLVAKIATEVGKPGGLIVVPPGERPPGPPAPWACRAHAGHRRRRTACRAAPDRAAPRPSRRRHPSQNAGSWVAFSFWRTIPARMMGRARPVGRAYSPLTPPRPYASRTSGEG